MGDVGSAGQSEGRRDIPWIWKSPGVLHNNDAGLQDCEFLLALSFEFFSSRHYQVYASNGARPEREHPDGQKSFLC